MLKILKPLTAMRPKKLLSEARSKAEIVPSEKIDKDVVHYEF